MSILGVDAVVLGVNDIAEGRRFYRDFGLTELDRGSISAEFETQDGSRIHLRSGPAVDATGRNAYTTVREVIWGVSDPHSLDMLASRVENRRPVFHDSDGTVRFHDNDGYCISLRLSHRQEFEPESNTLNIFGANPSRAINSRVDFLQAIRPSSIAHIVLFTPDVASASKFYIDDMGFVVTDRFKNDKGVFLRSSACTYHHNLFLIQGEKCALHHIAFPVTDFNQVVVGGKKLLSNGWDSKWGPGRHVLGSNYFWYFKSPCGGAMELTADMDRADEAWIPGEWEFKPENTAAWSLTFDSKK